MTHRSTIAYQPRAVRQMPGWPLNFTNRPAAAEAPRVALTREAVNPAAAVGAGCGETEIR